MMVWRTCASSHLTVLESVEVEPWAMSRSLDPTHRQIIKTIQSDRSGSRQVCCCADYHLQVSAHLVFVELRFVQTPIDWRLAADVELCLE